jgi:hypothetical protein
MHCALVDRECPVQGLDYRKTSSRVGQLLLTSEGGLRQPLPETLATSITPSVIVEGMVKVTTDPLNGSTDPRRVSKHTRGRVAIGNDGRASEAHDARLLMTYRLPSSTEPFLVVQFNAHQEASIGIHGIHGI